MTIKSTLRLLVARKNVERAAAGLPQLSQQQIAQAAGIPPSVVNGLMTNRVRRVDYRTLDKLCKFFGVQPGDLLAYEPDEEETAKR